MIVGGCFGERENGNDCFGARCGDLRWCLLWWLVPESAVIWRKWQTLCCRLEWDEKRDFLRMVKRLRDDCSNAVRQDGLHLAPNLVNVPLL